MTAALITERRHVEWRDLSPAARAFKEFLIEQGGALMDSWS